MNPQPHSSVIGYSIAALLLIAIFGFLVYMVISPHLGSWMAKRPAHSDLIVLTPKEAAEKAAIIESVMAEEPVTLSPDQAQAKAALVHKIQMGEE